MFFYKYLIKKMNIFITNQSDLNVEIYAEIAMVPIHGNTEIAYSMRRLIQTFIIKINFITQ